MKIAVSLGHGLAPPQAVTASQKLERFGCDFVWVSESVGFDSFPILGAIARQTRRIGLGTGVVNVYSRSATQIAMAAATLDSLSSGRFVLGIGASSAEVVEGWHGIEFKGQMERMSTYTDSLKAKLKRGHENSPIPFPPNRHDIPIFLAGVGDQMLKLARQKADGVLFFMRPLPDVKAKCKQLGSAKFRVCANVVTCVSADRKAAESRARRTVAFYLSYGAYGNLVERLAPPGAIREAVVSVRNDWLKGRREDAARRVPHDILAEVAIFGTPADCRRAIEEYAEIDGLDMLGLQFNAGAEGTDDSLNLYSTVFNND